jgi:exosortase A
MPEAGVALSEQTMTDLPIAANAQVVGNADDLAGAEVIALRPDAARRAELQSALACFAVGFVALLAIYHETVLDLWELWGKTGTFAHGYFIFPISAWLVWRARDELATIAPKAQPLALVPLAACGIVWLVARSAGVHAPEQFAFVGMFPCLVWAIFGNAITWRIAYPLAFLVFAVPAGDFMLPTLMDYTADFTVSALRMSGVPVYREGNYFSIPSGNWSVVEACSGLRYLIASITLGVLFAYLNYRAAWRRAAFIAAAILVPIVANWLRAYMIVMIAHLSNNKLATGIDHIIYGWLFFGLVMLLLFSIGNLWRDDLDDEQAAAAVAASAQARANGRASSTFALAGMAVAFLALAVPWPTLGNVIERIANAPKPGPIAIGAIDGWSPAPTPFTKFVPHFGDARSTESADFVADGRGVSFFTAYYSGQHDNGTMVTYWNDDVIVGDRIWGAVARRTLEASVAGRQLPVVESEVRGDTELGSERLLVWRWYWVNGRLTNSKIASKAYNALDKLAGRGDDSAAVVLSTPIAGPGASGVADARATLERFAAAALPRIDARLSAVHDEARR